MKKIFISHNQYHPAAKGLKLLINHLGGMGILIEDEPGAEPPDKKAYKLLRECEGFLAFCTKDLRGEQDRYFPKQNVALEIKEWQSQFGAKNMVILKECGCELPLLLGNPTYCEFDGSNLINAFERTVGEFQSMGLIPYLGSASNSNMPDKAKISLTEKEKKVLIFLSETENKYAYDDTIKSHSGMSHQEFNIMVNKLSVKSDLISEENSMEGRIVNLLDSGLDYLIEQKII